MRTAKGVAGIVLALWTVGLAAQSVPKRTPARPERVHVFPNNLVTVASSSPLYEIKIMVRTGSTDDPTGKEGTANLVAQSLIEGGFGDPQNPVTIQKLAEITRPWGERAFPTVLVDKQTTTFSMSVPRDAFDQFLARVLRPMMHQPLWLSKEVERLRRDVLTEIQSHLRFEDQETLGLLALDNYVFSGTNFGHLTGGTVKGLQAVARDDLQSFYKTYYGIGNMYVATTINEPATLTKLVQALPAGEPVMRPLNIARSIVAPGKHVLIITQPNAIATGLHLGFPIHLKHGDDEYWPLFVGNVFFGVHRDSFGRLYQELRGDRGYNYGDYSYIEYYQGRPQNLFPPPTTPREQQYFSMWIRPVGHQYAHFLMKAMTAELDRLVREGLTPEQVAQAKIKARTLYLNYAESKARQVGYRLDDLFYGKRDQGYLDQMLNQIDAVTPEQVNAALKKHLQAKNLDYVIVTGEAEGEKLADSIANNSNVVSKTAEEYHISQPVPPEKQQMLEQDKLWAAYALDIPRANITVIKASEMFETARQ